MLPRGRAIVLSLGNRATMVETVPWTTGPHSRAVKASIRAHDPAAAETIAEVEAAASRMQETIR